mgnify:CR=1 FL=1
MIFNGETINYGCIDNEGHQGNSINITDLYPILSVSKIDILKDLELINKQLKKLKNYILISLSIPTALKQDT